LWFLWIVAVSGEDTILDKDDLYEEREEVGPFLFFKTAKSKYIYPMIK